MLTPRAAADPFPSLPFLPYLVGLAGCTCPSQHSVMVSVTHSHNPHLQIPILFILDHYLTRTQSYHLFIYSYSIWKPKQSSEEETNQSKSEALSTATMEDLPPGYRPNVGVCLINSDNLIFVGSRLNVPGAWQMPQGGIEDGEEPKSAAIRELREETGIESAEIIAEVPNWLTYDFPPAVKTKVNRLWGGEWHGQAQKWFLMRFTKDESEINLATGEADPEFAEWKWANPEEVIEQAVDYKRPTYEEVMKTFKSYLDGSALSAKCKSTKW